MKKMTLFIGVACLFYLGATVASYWARVERGSLIKNLFLSKNLGGMNDRIKLGILILSDISNQQLQHDELVLTSSVSSAQVLGENKFDAIFNGIYDAYQQYRVLLNNVRENDGQSPQQIRFTLQENFPFYFIVYGQSAVLTSLDIFDKLITPEKIAYYDSIHLTEASLQTYLLMPFLLDENNYFSSLNPNSLEVPKAFRELVPQLVKYSVDRREFLNEERSAQALRQREQAQLDQEVKKRYEPETKLERCSIL